MRLAVVFLVLLGSPWIPDDAYAQFSRHKSETEIARMTPEQRVEEYCTEYVRHSVTDDDYQHLLESCIGHDGVKAVPHLVKIIDVYDPARLQAGGKERSERFDAASILLSEMDETVVRLRASDEGRKAIKAMTALLERMRAAHFDTGESYHRRNTYEILAFSLKSIQGINLRDEAIRDTLRLKYNISLSDSETLNFANYLVLQDPTYPGWSETELYKDMNRRNEAGNPLQYLVVKKVEPFYKAYLNFKIRVPR